MKICPFCKAQIEENARFCLYCMTPLVEKEIILPQLKKKPLWLYWVVGVLAAALLVAVLWPAPQKPASSQTGTTLIAPSTAATVPTKAPTAVPTTAPATALTTAPTKEPTTAPTATSTNTSTAASVSEPTTAPTTVPTAPTETVGSVVYGYYQASDSLELGTVAETDVIITDIMAPVGTKEIVIPAYMGGKRVVGLDFSGFNSYSRISSSVTSVYLPETLALVGYGVFENTNIQHLYIAGESLYLSNDGYTEKMQIHCSQTCKNKALQRLFSSSEHWVEWNGAMPEPTNFIALPTYDWRDPDGQFRCSYRQAVQSDVLGLDYQVTENDVVITHIFDFFNDYPLFLPDYIDGKRVVALGSSVFKEPGGAISVEKIYLPETLLAIHRDVFTGTDISSLCIEGETLAMDDKSALEDVKIMCSKTCVDQYGDKYSELTSWREWNG